MNKNIALGMIGLGLCLMSVGVEDVWGLSPKFAGIMWGMGFMITILPWLKEKVGKKENNDGI